MRVHILHYARCPCCGYRNLGHRFGSGRPRMTGITVAAPHLAYLPDRCGECRHPIGRDLYSQGEIRLDQETTRALNAWQARQRARRTARRTARNPERTLNG